MERLAIISTSLKFLFESIESLLSVKFENEILDKILDDYKNDQVNEKNYKLNSEKEKIKISGLVEEYEPESIWLKFENVNRKRTIELKELFDNYEFAFGSGAYFRSTEDSLAIYRRGIRGLIEK